MRLLEIKYFNALIGNKPFFDQPVKNKQEVYEKLIEMSRNNDYTTKNLLVYLYLKKNFMNLLAQIYKKKKKEKRKKKKEINFVGKLEEGHYATMFSIVQKRHKAILNFSLVSLIVIK